MGETDRNTHDEGCSTGPPPLEPVTQEPRLGLGVWEGLPREVAFELGFEGRVEISQMKNAGEQVFHVKYANIPERRT